MVYNDDEQDYAWIKRGMIFSFIDHVDRCVIDRSFCLLLDGFTIVLKFCFVQVSGAD